MATKQLLSQIKSTNIPTAGQVATATPASDEITWVDPSTLGWLPATFTVLWSYTTPTLILIIWIERIASLIYSISVIMTNCTICRKHQATYKLSYDIDCQPIYICSEECHHKLLVQLYGSVSTIEAEYVTNEPKPMSK